MNKKEFTYDDIMDVSLDFLSLLDMDDLSEQQISLIDKMLDEKKFKMKRIKGKLVRKQVCPKGKIIEKGKCVRPDGKKKKALRKSAIKGAKTRKGKQKEITAKAERTKNMSSGG